MAYHHPSARGTSSNLEKIALQRFRDMMAMLPEKCRIYRDVWNDSTVLCLDFQLCPDELPNVRKHSFLLLLGANYLGLSHSILFRLDQKVDGWVNMMSTAK